MRPGTPGFCRARLTAAREARGISRAALSEMIGVTRSAVSQYERGDQTPSPTVLHRIATALNLPTWHFCTDGISVESPVFYRSFSSALKSARTRAERRLEWLHEIVLYLQQSVEFPAINVPHVDLPQDVLDLSGEDVEDIAKTVRRSWGLGDGPISHVTRLLENNGIIAVRHFLDTDKLDAFSYWQSSKFTPLMVLSSDKNCAVRSRFDAAHELAHLVLHSNLDEDDLLSRSKFKVIEQQANRFAGAFLLPSTTFLAELFALTPEALLSLKRRWGTSVALMVKRCEDLGVGNEETIQRLWIKIGRRGWRKKEPLDDEIEIEVPMFLRRAFDLLLTQPDARDLILSQLPWTPEELEQLVDLTQGTFSATGDEQAESLPKIIRFPSAS